LESEIERLKKEILNLSSFNEHLSRDLKMYEKKTDINEGEKKISNKKKDKIISVPGDNANSESEMSEEKTVENLSHRRKTAHKNKSKNSKNENLSVSDLNSTSESLSKRMTCKNSSQVLSVVKTKKEFGKIHLVSGKLHCSGEYIEDIGTSKLSIAIQSVQNNLTYLDLALNNIKNQGAIDLSKALGSINCKLIYLNLSENPIQSEPIKYLFQSLQNACLKTLIISRIKLDKEAIGYISDFIQNNQGKLTTLVMNGNNICNKGVGRISEALKANTTITELDLSSNHITDPGGYCIKEAVRLNHTLNRLWLKGNYKLTNPCKEEIIQSWISGGSRQVAGCIFKYKYVNSSQNK